MGETASGGQSGPSERAAKVRQRVKELNQRRTELAAGERPTPESVALAHRRAEESLRRAKEAHHAAALRHEELARVHERTANSYQRAALQGLGPTARLQQAADEHWQAAHDDHLAALEDEAESQDPKESSSG
ncbi:MULTISPECIES: hypothetical protein [unclassified Mycobacterium]|uniref:hypothetical protein n=1 Tax=unclassified Mycobacterium TaxID=2642494 RepID=UPI0008021A4C|nr:MULTISPECIES: hypothetical protein [unclassified Mycobacterium]OBI17051.1 hypothetical protein A5713_20790 [Mycobacterium sp. E2497]